MTAVTKSSSTPRSPWPHTHKSSTPNGLTKARTPASVGHGPGHSHAPRLNNPGLKSPTKEHHRSPSPNYFGLIVEGAEENPTDSNAGQHAKKNWKSPSSSIQSKVSAKSPGPVPHDQNPEYEEFRKQSEAYAFSLGQRNFSGLSQYSHVPSPLSRAASDSGNVRRVSFDNDGRVSPKQTVAEMPDAMELDSTSPEAMRPGSQQNGFFDMPRHETPENMPTLSTLKPRLSDIDERHPRLSLPHNRVSEVSPEASVRRSDTLPPTLSHDGPKFIEPQNAMSLLEQPGQNKVLLLDIRVSPQYSQSRLTGALNLCIPTTLIKRPAFGVDRLTATFNDPGEKDLFSKWKSMNFIVVYDASSSALKDATMCVNTIKKFTNEGYEGHIYILKGGFKEASKVLPHLVERQGSGVDTTRILAAQAANNAMPVAGGCPMPDTKNAANPFFSNIRQNYDLIGGVGQVAVKLPDSLGPRGLKALPAWLRDAVDQTDAGKAVSEKFLQIEKEEQGRMKKALSGHVSYGTPSSENPPDDIQIAGIEKGTKNRYKDMLPYDHSRVKLQNEDSNACDYINASHVKAQWSNRRYVATQAPVPTTFEDFWRVIWEQDVRVLVMLSAEIEGNQRKCHPYWIPGSYGPMKVKALSERRVSLQLPETLASSLRKAQLASPTSPSSRRRGVTNAFGGDAATANPKSPSSSATPDLSEPPHVIVRTLALSHAAYPFNPIREVTQISYSQWPDFGTPAHPADLLALVEHTNVFARQYNASSVSGSGNSARNAGMPVSDGEAPILVHCSAGCGRTGTFCAIDSAVDMLKRQRARIMGMDGSERGPEKPQGSQRVAASHVDGDVDRMDGVAETVPTDWVDRDDIDLIEKAVKDFRSQRLSMVQTLRQFVLCYEAVLEWLVREAPERFKGDMDRRSFQG